MYLNKHVKIPLCSYRTYLPTQQHGHRRCQWSTFSLVTSKVSLHMWVHFATIVRSPGKRSGHETSSCDSAWLCIFVNCVFMVPKSSQRKSKLFAGTQSADQATTVTPELPHTTNTAPPPPQQVSRHHNNRPIFNTTIIGRYSTPRTKATDCRSIIGSARGLSNAESSWCHMCLPACSAGPWRYQCEIHLLKLTTNIPLVNITMGY